MLDVVFCQGEIWRRANALSVRDNLPGGSTFAGISLPRESEGISDENVLRVVLLTLAPEPRENERNVRYYVLFAMSTKTSSFHFGPHAISRAETTQYFSLPAGGEGSTVLIISRPLVSPAGMLKKGCGSCRISDYRLSRVLDLPTVDARI